MPDEGKATKGGARVCSPGPAEQLPAARAGRDTPALSAPGGVLAFEDLRRVWERCPSRGILDSRQQVSESGIVIAVCGAARPLPANRRGSHRDAHAQHTTADRPSVAGQRVVHPSATQPPRGQPEFGQRRRDKVPPALPSREELSQSRRTLRLCRASSPKRFPPPA